MRKVKSIVALVSALAVMACQTAVASSGVMRQPLAPPAASSAGASAQSPSAGVPARAEDASTAFAAEGASHRKTWIIVGVVAAIVAVAVIIAAGGSSSAY